MKRVQNKTVANELKATITNKKTFTIEQYYQGVKLLAKLRDKNINPLEITNTKVLIARIGNDIKKDIDYCMVFKIEPRTITGSHTIMDQGQQKVLRIDKCTEIAIPYSYLVPSYTKENLAKIDAILAKEITDEKKIAEIEKVLILEPEAIKTISDDGNGNLVLDLGTCEIDVFDKDIDFTIMQSGTAVRAYVVKDLIKTTKALIGFQMKENDYQRRISHYQAI